ncbi:MAG: glycosyltransferase [Bacillota bacterium]
MTAIRVWAGSAPPRACCRRNEEKALLRRLETWFLWRLQRLEGAGFDAVRTAAWQDVQILHGLCSVFNLRALLEVGGYTPGHMLEDYDLTLRLRRAGWRTMFCPRMRAWTRVPLTFRSFFRQRLRWMRGGMDILLQRGIDRFTLGDLCQHLLFLLLFAGVVTHLALHLILGGRWRLRFFLHPLPLVLAGLGQVWSLYKLRFLERIEAGDLVLRLAVLPELLVAVALSFLQVRAYFLSLFARPQEW